MNRRKFISITGIGAAALALPAAGIFAKTLHETVTDIIYREFNYLNLDKEGVDLYVHAYLEKNKKDLSYEMKLKAFDLFRISSEKSTILTQMTQDYILSTDFFINKMDESKTVHFIGAYDAYNTPCANPFSSLYYPSDNI
ncbi:MAG TPA: hypothetical protein VK921_11085 [Anditalea sp.]|nr:hypothetical protein [Anditalea sp.]